MARCTAEDWKHQLPWVLLGLRTAPRADSTPSAAEQTYGEPLVVPGELVTEDRHTPSLQRLRDVAGKFTPCKRTYTGRSTIFTPPELSSATHVFVRVDAIRPPLTRPYRGPFRMLERNSKAFLLALPGKADWVSVNRLKPAFLTESTDAATAPSPPSRTSPWPCLHKRRARGRPRKGPPAPAAQQPHARETPPDIQINQTCPTSCGGKDPQAPEFDPDEEGEQFLPLAFQENFLDFLSSAVQDSRPLKASRLEPSLN
ncbi:uncharacterized protein [Macrobrachium rosenbergii]|uniref:uncharacterized protein n=1 Tax=Macrobrachium rosenbergii TaxID=79674 RepID=UPI0034D4CFCC